MSTRRPLVKAIAAVVLATSLATTGPAFAEARPDTDSVVGAWRAKVQFKSGAFAAVKDLEFMYAFNAGGTLTESSNYDGAPPVPPAYGVWRQVQPRQYEARYLFFASKAPKAFDEIAKGGGWQPGGSGVLVERISLSEDGKTFRSTITLDVVDESGKRVESSTAEASAVRIGF